MQLATAVLSPVATDSAVLSASPSSRTSGTGTKQLSMAPTATDLRLHVQLPAPACTQGVSSRNVGPTSAPVPDVRDGGQQPRRKTLPTAAPEPATIRVVGVGDKNDVFYDAPYFGPGDKGEFY